MAKGRGASKTLSSDITERKRAEHNLKERIKELNCLYGIARIAERPDFTLDELYQEVVNLLPSSWQYPEITCARIIINGKKFKTENCRETEWKQSSDIKVHGAKAGILEVGYLEERPELEEGPFLKEERLLIDAAAKQLGRITERKQMEQALQQSEEKLQTYLESAPDGVYINDLKGTFLYGNEKAEELTGYKREELVGKSFLKLNLLPAKYLAKAGRLLALNAMGKPTGPDELELIKRDGSRIWVEITTTPIKQAEGKTEVIGFVRDITERKRAEEKIQQQNKFLSNILNSLTYPFYVVDANDYTINIANKAAKMGNLSENATCYALTHKSSKPCGNIDHVCPLEEVKKTKKPVVVEHIHYDEDGNARNVEVHGYPILDTEGNVIQMIEYCLDITERKRAEEALERQRAYFQQLFDNSPDAIAWLDAADRIVQVNRGFETLFGYRAEEAKGRFINEVIVPEDRIKEASAMSRAALNHAELRKERVRKRKDGSLVDVDTFGYPIWFGNKAIGIFAIYSDISERKQAEEALRKSEEKYRTLFESKLDGMLVIDETMKPLLANKTAAEMFGFDSVEELLEVNIFDYIPPEERERALKIITKDMFEKDMRQVNEFRLMTKSGKEIWISVIGALTEYEGKVAGLISLRDITERKQMEEQLKESEERYRNLVQSALDIIYTVSLDGTVTSLNPAFETITGWSRSEWIGKQFASLVHPDDVPLAMELFQKAVQAEAAGALEARILAKSGEYLLVEVKSTLLTLNERVVGFWGIARDITERKRMEQELKEAQEQLISSERLAAIGQLASGVAHELRGPLGAIKTAAFYVQRRLAKSDLPATEPKVLEFLDIIDGEVNIASNVISDLIGFSRVAKPTISPVNIGGIIEDALKHVPIPENVNLARDIDKSLPMVVVDAGQIQQVFVNVIFNAVEAMPQGGRLGIRAGSKSEFVEVEFTDTGCGVPRSAIDNIFDPLFTTKARGIGLGLAVCKSILERHGGDIRVKNKVGKGSTFTVSLPTQVI